MRLGAAAHDLAGLSLPAGWTGTKRADLEAHLVYGVFDRATVRRALTAIVASGLSLHAQVRARRRPSRAITSASLGLYLPLDNTPAPGGLAVEGQALAELLGCDIDATGPLLAPAPRAARRVVVGFEIRRAGGWLIGGPGAASRPAPLELRSIEVAVRLSIGGPAPALDRCEVILHGVRIHDRAFPRLVLSPGLTDADLGIDGLAAPTTPEIRQLVSLVMQELEASADAALARIAEALKAVGVLDAAGGFDGLSLSNWIDDPATRLQESLADSGLRQRLMDLIAGLAGDHAGLSFDPAARSLTVALSGTTGEPVFGEWAVSGAVSPAGITGGTLRLGAAAGLHFAATLDPFALALRLPPDLAQGLGGLPEALPIWPAPNVALLARPVLPGLAAFALSKILDGLRRSDPAVAPVVDAALTAFGLLRTAAEGGQVTAVPPLVFIDPGKWIKAALGTADAVTAARVIAALDALKPLVNLPGGPGAWDVAPGISLRARSQAGTVLEITLDPAQFMPAADVAFGGAFGLRFGTDGSVRPSLDVFVGLKGGAAGSRAAHLVVAGSDVALFLRPAAGGDIGIYPDVGGLTQLAAAGIVAALPAALDAIVATATAAGDLLADIGDALQLRQGGNFDGAALTAWATDPAGTLQARWPQLLAGGLTRLGPALPAGVAVTTPAGGVRLQVNNAGTAGSVFAVAFIPSPVAVEVSATVASIPFVRRVEATLRFDASGLSRLRAEVGPAEIPLVDAIVLRPVVEIDVGSAVADPFVATGLAVDAANSNALALRYDFDTASFDLGFGGNSPEEIAAGIMRFAIDLVGSFVMDLDPVQEILALDVGAVDVRSVLEDVVLVAGGGLDPEFFRVIPNPGETPQQFFDAKLQRVLALLDNIAKAAPSVSIGGELAISLAKSGGSIGLGLTLSDRLEIVGGDIAVWLENDSRWIIGGPPAGIAIGLLKVAGGNIDFEPSLSVNGRRHPRRAEQRAAARLAVLARLDRAARLRADRRGRASGRRAGPARRDRRGGRRRGGRQPHRAGHAGGDQQRRRGAGAGVQPGLLGPDAAGGTGRRRRLQLLGRRGRRAVVAADPQAVRSALHRAGRAGHAGRPTTRCSRSRCSSTAACRSPGCRRRWTTWSCATTSIRAASSSRRRGTWTSPVSPSRPTCRGSCWRGACASSARTRTSSTSACCSPASRPTDCRSSAATPRSRAGRRARSPPSSRSAR